MIVKILDIRIEKRTKDTKRIRVDFGDIVQLAKSIKENGLLHPPVVTEDKTGEKLYVLVVGERRLRALIFNGETETPVTLFDDLDEIDQKILELEENVIRKDLDWPEQIEALRQLNELQSKKYGESSRSRQNTGWTMEDMASACGRSRSSVSDDILLAKTIKDRPDLRKVVKKLPKHAAKKIIKQKLEEEMLQRRIERNELTISADLRLGDCRDLIKEIPSNSIDLWLTDPPFGAAHIVGASGSDSPSEGMPLYNLTSSNVGTDEEMQKIYDVLIPEVYRVLKPGAHIYVFFGHAWYTRLYKMLREVGFHVDEQPLIWYKKRVSIMAKDMHYMSSYEAIFFGHKLPTGRILSKPVSNVLSIPALSHQVKTHPLQRPHELLKILIENSSNVGETVLDTFAGSASTLVSAKKLQRQAIGFELDEGNFLRAQEFMSKKLKS